MKKILSIFLLLSTILMAADKTSYEISPILGYDIAEGNLEIKNNSYSLVGVEIQGNIPNLKLNPELSMLYSSNIEYNNGQKTDIFRAMLNAVYTFDSINAITPFVKIGFGFEQISNPSNTNRDDLFFDGGAGAKIKLMQNLDLKLEFVYMNKHKMMTYSMLGNTTTNDTPISSNFLTLIGLNFTFFGK